MTESSKLGQTRNKATPAVTETPIMHSIQPELFQPLAVAESSKQVIESRRKVSHRAAILKGNPIRNTLKPPENLHLGLVLFLGI